MFAGNWFGKWSPRSGAKSRQPLAKGRRRKDVARERRLRLEELEDRRVLATLIVNNPGDLDANGNVITGTLRNAVQVANSNGDAGNTIVFADFLFTHPTTRQTVPVTISLDGRAGELAITKPLQILGPGAATLTVAAGGSNMRLFNINIESDEIVRPVTIGGMTLAGGNLTTTANDDSGRGGAIINREALTLIEVDAMFNSASQGGGVVYSPIGSVNVTRSLIRNNSSGGGGGAILLGEPESDDLRPGLTVANSTFTGNSTFGTGQGDDFRPGFGGGIYNRSGNATISHSTFVGNSSTAGGGGVATNGVELAAMGTENPPPIRTSLTHNILFDNTGVSNSLGNADDVFAVRRVQRDDQVVLLAPTLLIDGPGLGYNFIGSIGGTEWWDPTDAMNPGNGHFYQVVFAGGGDDAGISWTLANAHTTYGQPGRGPMDPMPGSHLATPSIDDPMTGALENAFLFGPELVGDPQFWTTFQPEDIGDPPMTPPLQDIGPWFGARQTDRMNETPMTSMGADTGWEWVTADLELFPDPGAVPPIPGYQNWAMGQPNNGILPGAMLPDEAGAEEGFILFYGEAGGPVDTWGDSANEPEGEGASPVAFAIEYDQGTNFFNVDPRLLPLGDYGGATQVFYPNTSAALFSPVIDAGDPAVFGDFDQRGLRFVRNFGGAVDIGAVEAQLGIFQVDTLFDETDGQTALIYDPILSPVPDPTYTQPGDFSLREAIEFSEKNPEFDTITFTNALIGLPDPTASPAPTILLKLRADANSALAITQPVDIFGPTGFELEVDAVGNDLTPTQNNSDGTRVLIVDNGSAGNAIDVSISGLTFLGGDVVGSGGAILNRENLTLDSFNIRENFAGLSGGGISTRDGELTVINSTIYDNIAGFEGGGLLVDQGQVGTTKATVRNSTLSGNSAARGAGVLNNDGELLVEYSTVTQNVSVNGAGIANLNRPNSLTQIHSSIVSANIGDDVKILQGAVPNFQSLGFNIVGTGNALAVFVQPGDQLGVTNPMLSPLLLDGGFRPVHRVLAGSPAIDAGESTAVAGTGNVPMYDERGFPFTRVFDGLGDTKDRIDVGAYELQGNTFIVDTLLDENDGDVSPGFLSLREAIDLSNSNPLTDTIMFDAAILANGTIFQSAKNTGFLLPGTETTIRITDSVNIVGLGSSLLTLDGSLAFTDPLSPPPIGDPPFRSRWFTIDDGDNASDIEVNISGLTFTNSFDITEVGAVIKSSEQLALEDIAFVSNSTLGDGFNGGAVYQRYGSLNLDNVVLTSNTTDGVDADGGALYVRDADLTIRNSTISGNSTTQTLGSGGGLYIRDGLLDMQYGYVSGNIAPGGEADGAGIFGRDATLLINNSYITGNSMTGSNSEGAGIHVQNSNLTLTNSFIGLNSTSGTQSEGAGLYAKGGITTIDRSSISQNTTTGMTSTGGGIAVVDGTVTVLKSTLDRNGTSGLNASGGAIHNLNGQVTIVDSTISGSQASGSGSRGGGIYNSTALGSSDKTTLINSTVSGNHSGNNGGGIFNAKGLTEIRFSTITNNSAPFIGNGGGVASLANSSTTTTQVYSSIIAGNFAASAGNAASDVDNPVGIGQNSFQSLGYNVIGTGLSLALNGFTQPGDQRNIIDPKLGILSFNGGPTLTHKPAQDSPAVNAGDPTPTSAPAFDQRGTGFARILAGRMDAGSYETAFTPVIPADFDSDGDSDGADFLLWQRGFGKTNAVKSDGDANNDTVVNSIDLGFWQSEFGTVSLAPLAALSGGGSVETVSASLSTEDSSGEPLAAASVLNSSQSLAGLVLNVVSDDGDVVLLETAENAESSTNARDHLFASLAPVPASRGYDSLTTDPQGDDDANAMEFTVEDHFFELLGSNG